MWCAQEVRKEGLFYALISVFGKTYGKKKIEIFSGSS